MRLLWHLHPLLQGSCSAASFEYFTFWQVGRVEEVDEVPDSDKLLRCQVDLGPVGKRQVCPLPGDADQLQGRPRCAAVGVSFATTAEWYFRGEMTLPSYRL